MGHQITFGQHPRQPYKMKSKMINKERLQQLKKLKIERGNGPLFKSADECMEWIDNAAPLLKYEKNHYETFMANAHYVRITTLSADRLMSHLNPMIGVVNQAIIELENNIKSPTDPNPTQEPYLNKIENKHNWHDEPLGKIALGTIIIVLGAIILWVINHYLTLEL